MKVCVFGAGAVGSYMVARLANVPGVELSAVARGGNLRALQASGVRVDAPGAEYSGRPAVATDRPETLPPQDVVFVTLKSTALPVAAPALFRLLGPGGHAVFVTNGIPWWWNHGQTGSAGPLPLLDPEGALWNVLEPQRALGCVVHSGNEIVTPGVVRHNGNNHWLVGEPDNTDSARLRRTVAVMQSAGLKAEVSTALRRDIFAKLLRNAPFNSICALTGLPLEWLATEPSVKALTLAVMDEIVAIGAARGLDVGAELAVCRQLKTPPDRMAPALGQKPSMLQDVLARRPLEVEAIFGQVCAFADETNTPCPAMHTLLPLLRGLDLHNAMRPVA
jgi:2-dehydropantoate 2-reductase